MTEQDWPAASDPEPILAVLKGKGSDRKLRLFAVACCREVSSLYPDNWCRNAVEVADRHAEGLSSKQELTLARKAVRHSRADEDLVHSVKYAVRDATKHRAVEAASAYYSAAQTGRLMSGDSDRDSRENDIANLLRNQANRLRDIFGNPFHPVTFNRVWLAPTTTSLAKRIYDDRQLPSGLFDNQRMDVLADALEEVGCDNADILNHCRQPGVHVRGCWVVDLLLGKE